MYVDMSNEKAEAELLELVRLQDAQEFSVTIAHSGGKWSVITESFDPPGKMMGGGNSFAEAWHGQDPLWARNLGQE